MMVPLVTQGVSVTPFHVDPRQHPIALEKVERAVHRGAAHSLRMELIGQRFGIDHARLRDQRPYDNFARASHPLAAVSQSAQEPIGTREIAAAARASIRHSVYQDVTPF